MTQATKSVQTQKPSETFVFQSGTPYADKDEYIEKSLTFDIQAIAFEPNAGFEGQDRWSIRAYVNDGRGEELITLQSNDKRDEQLRSAQQFIESKGPIKGARLKKSGKTFYFENAGGAP